MEGKERARSRDESELDTESLRRERGESGTREDPRDKLGDVPIAPHSAGVLGIGAAPGVRESGLAETVEDDLREARSRDGSTGGE